MFENGDLDIIEEDEDHESFSIKFKRGPVEIKSISNLKREDFNFDGDDDIIWQDLGLGELRLLSRDEA